MKERHPNDIYLPSSNVSPIRSNPEWDNIKPISHDDIINSKPDPLENVLNPWLPTQGIAFVYAAQGVGKTLFTLNVAYAIASGGNFLKYSAPKPKRVLYVDGEMAYNQIHKRYVEVVNQQGCIGDGKYFHLLNADLVGFPLPKICNLEGQEFYNKKIADDGIQVLFLDNLSMLSAIDENKSNEWKIIQDWLISLRSRGLSVVIVHHAGKETKGYRGTSRMLDAPDTAISLQSVTQDQLEIETTNSRRFKIDYQKNRTFGGEDALGFEATLTSTGWEWQTIEQTNMDKIVERVNIKMPQKDIALELGKSRPYISKMVKKAKALKLITEVD